MVRENFCSKSDFFWQGENLWQDKKSKANMTIEIIILYDRKLVYVLYKHCLSP